MKLTPWFIHHPRATRIIHFTFHLFSPVSIESFIWSFVTYGKDALQVEYIIIIIIIT